jgi:arylformamidase
MDAHELSPAPLVWRNYDQATLDAAYDQSRYAPNQADVKARRIQMAKIALERLGQPEVFAYGDSPDQRFDLYRTDRRVRPLVVYVHGGAWRNGTAREFAFLAELFADAGAHFAALDFDQIDTCQGNLFPMVEQVRRAIAHLFTRATDYAVDLERIYVIGHSSGAHLTGCLVTTDWTQSFGLSPHVLRGALLCSGMYDLEPVRLSARSRYVAFTDAIEHELSPLRHIRNVACPLVLAHGTLETPEFQRQTVDFAAALAAAEKPAELIVATGYNHFEILETLASPYGVLGRAALRLTGLTTA